MGIEKRDPVSQACPGIVKLEFQILPSPLVLFFRTASLNYHINVLVFLPYSFNQNLWKFELLHRQPLFFPFPIKCDGCPLISVFLFHVNVYTCAFECTCMLVHVHTCTQAWRNQYIPHSVLMSFLKWIGDWPLGCRHSARLGGILDSRNELVSTINIYCLPWVPHLLACRGALPWICLSIDTICHDV